MRVIKAYSQNDITELIAKHGRLITRKEAAEIFKLHPAVIKRLIKKGTLTCSRPRNCRVTYLKLAEVADLFEAVQR